MTFLALLLSAASAGKGRLALAIVYCRDCWFRNPSVRVSGGCQEVDEKLLLGVDTQSYGDT